MVMIFLGAVYIDSGHCLHTVKRVYESFNPQYEAVMKEPPRNPKSQLHELCYSVRFSPAEVSTVTYLIFFFFFVLFMVIESQSHFRYPAACRIRLDLPDTWNGRKTGRFLATR
jgi:hypothetical protein